MKLIRIRLSTSLTKVMSCLNKLLDIINLFSFGQFAFAILHLDSVLQDMLMDLFVRAPSILKKS